MTNPAPIGVFDSGMGGLTVVAEIIRQLPHESIIYFGDTARVPYGPKSPDTVLRYSREITSYLKDEGVKALVVACNTATRTRSGAAREFDMPIIGVIEPAPVLPRPRRRRNVSASSERRGRSDRELTRRR